MISRKRSSLVFQYRYGVPLPTWARWATALIVTPLNPCFTTSSSAAARTFAALLFCATDMVVMTQASLRPGPLPSRCCVAGNAWT